MTTRSLSRLKYSGIYFSEDTQLEDPPQENREVEKSTTPTIMAIFFIMIQMLMPLLYMLASPYYYGNLSYLFQSLIMMLPYSIAFIIGLILSIYTLIKSRKIAKSYSEFISTNSSISKVTTFCPNCGNKKSEEEKFCNQCGQELR